MEKEQEFKNEYLSKCKAKPGWVKDKDDAMKYAAHLAHRLYQAKEIIKSYENELQRVHQKLYEDAYDRAQEKSEVLQVIWGSDENHTNFTDWTPVKSMGELYPEYFEKKG